MRGSAGDQGSRFQGPSPTLCAGAQGSDGAVGLGSDLVRQRTRSRGKVEDDTRPEALPFRQGPLLWNPVQHQRTLRKF